MPVDPYREYLERFDHEIGPTAVGGYGKRQGRLVRKLAPEEFTSKWGEYAKLNAHYQKALDRGDTLSDILVRAIAEKRAELLLPTED